MRIPSDVQIPLAVAMRWDGVPVLSLLMMEKSVKGEFSASGRSFPPYSTGNNHNTWYAATMVDARGVEIPYLDRDGNDFKDCIREILPGKGTEILLKRWRYRRAEV